jgi:hypothetical protein
MWKQIPQLEKRSLGQKLISVTSCYMSHLKDAQLRTPKETTSCH